MTGTSRPQRSAWLDPADVHVDDLAALTSARHGPSPVPVYDSARLRARAATADGRRAVQDELVHAHAAGHNRSAGIRRMANLLQVSSAFGRAMEQVDRGVTARAVFPSLVALRERGAPDEWVHNAATAAAEGYAFPTDLDTDPPVDGLAPPAPVEVLLQAVHERWPPRRWRSCSPTDPG